MPIQSCIVFDCTSPTLPIPVGNFVMDTNGNGRFGYDVKYAQASLAFALDPIHVPLQHNELPIPCRGDGSFGVFSEAGPNAWGSQLKLKTLTRIQSSGTAKRRRMLP